MSGRTDISPDTQETNISETTLDDTDLARIAAEEAARQAEWDAKMAACSTSYVRAIPLSFGSSIACRAH
jgi:hypothetical protein